MFTSRVFPPCHPHTPTTGNAPSLWSALWSRNRDVRWYVDHQEDACRQRPFCLSLHKPSRLLSATWQRRNLCDPNTPHFFTCCFQNPPEEVWGLQMENRRSVFDQAIPAQCYTQPRYQISKVSFNCPFRSVFWSFLSFWLHHTLMPSSFLLIVFSW